MTSRRSSFTLKGMTPSFFFMGTLPFGSAAYYFVIPFLSRGLTDQAYPGKGLRREGLCAIVARKKMLRY